MIGDGMGPQQIGLLQLWAQHAEGSTLRSGTAFERLGAEGTLGLSMTNPADALVVDSACSATQLATGLPALSEVVGLDDQGRSAPTVLERAEAAGLATGLVSDTRITHATPASFASHAAHRSMENDIAAQLIASGAEVLLSGGARHFAGAEGAAYEAPFEPGSRRDDGRDLLAEAQAAGYALAFDAAGLDAAVEAGGPVLGLFASSSMRDAFAEGQGGEPTLEAMTLAALSVLEREEDGFFLMIEGGQIDWAGHDNDAGWLLHEMLRFERTLQAVLTWMEGRDDTLLVVTADHETGGFSFSYHGTNLPTAVGLATPAFAERLYGPNFQFGTFEQLDGLHAQESSLSAMFDAAGGDATPAELVAVVNERSAFPITEAQAAAALATQPNPYSVEGHAYMGAAEVPLIADFAAHYPYASPTAALARELSNAQNVTWSTGTHTHTPVPVFAVGPGAERFGALQHHTDVGRTMQELLFGSSMGSAR